MMKKTKLFLLFFLWAPFYALSVRAAEPLSQDVVVGWDSIRAATLKKDVTYITGDKFQGRLALDKGDELATQWIADQFLKAGLKPAYENSYLQPVKIIKFMPDDKNSYLALQRSGEEKRWKKPDIYMDFPENNDVSGDLVFAGYGITAPELQYDDYQNIDVHGKIVLVFDHEPQETNSSSIFNGTGNTLYATPRVKALNAQRHGAIAVLIVPEPNANHPSNLERRARIGGLNKLPSMVLMDDELHIPMAILSNTTTKKIAGKTPLSELQTAIDKNLQPQSRIIPDTKISLHQQIKSRSLGTTYNVVGLLEGSDATLKNETIIISAHHDHDGKNDRKIWHGADDNASGTIGVVTLAKAMTANNDAKNGLKVKRSILFVVFAAEERGLLGAFYMAAHPLRPLATTRAMINFDMIGRNEARSNQTEGLIDIPSDTTNRLNLIGSHYSPDYDRIVQQENKWVGLTIDHRFDNEYTLNTFFRSDQFPFVLHDIPAFWWFTGFHPDYHHITDTADKINYVKMQNILRLAYLSAFVFANETTPPKFIKDPRA